MTLSNPAPPSLRIDDLAYGGAGVARKDGRVWLVPGAWPGELVRAEPAAVRARHVEGRVVEIIEPSPDRTDAGCPLAPPAAGRADATACPGCHYQRLAYAAELEWKARQLSTLMRRIGGADFNRDAIRVIPSPSPTGYRNKLTLHARPGRRGRGALGFFAADNATIVPVASCPLALPPINARLARERADAAKGSWELTIRHTARDGAVAWRGAPPPGLRLTESVGRLDVRVPPGSFFQVNALLSPRLLDEVVGAVAEASPRLLLDICCGAGFFSLAAAAAGAVPLAEGVDTDPDAAGAAAEAARAHGLEGLRYHADSAAAFLRRSGAALARRAGGALCAVADPPRRGLGADAIGALAALAPRRVVYVSCAPDTLARDTRSLLQHGYALRGLSMLDMFPRTARFEAVAVFDRPAPGAGIRR